MTKTATAVRIPTARRGPAGTSHATFRRDVDGLLGLAVALLVLFDAGVPGLGGGFVGADVLFVVSGYLIARLLLARRLGTQRMMPFAAGSIVGGALAWSILHTTAWSDLSAATRAWQLGAGVLVALAGNDRHRIPYRLAGGLSWLGLVLIMASVLVLRPGTTLPVPALGAMLVLVGRGDGLLSLPPMRWLGGIAWAFLLWHIPVLRSGCGDAVPVSLALAVLTYAVTNRWITRSRILELCTIVAPLVAAWWTLPRFGAAHVQL